MGVRHYPANEIKSLIQSVHKKKKRKKKKTSLSDAPFAGPTQPEHMLSAGRRACFRAACIQSQTKNKAKQLKSFSFKRVFNTLFVVSGSKRITLTSNMQFYLQKWFRARQTPRMTNTDHTGGGRRRRKRRKKKEKQNKSKQIKTTTILSPFLRCPYRVVVLQFPFFMPLSLSGSLPHTLPDDEQKWTPPPPTEIHCSYKLVAALWI